MKRIVQRLVGIGADFSTRRTLKSALNIIGIKPENIDRVYIELKNSINQKAFKEIPPSQKILFLPQCLRNADVCKAGLKRFGYECAECGSCKAFKIKKRAESLGYRVFIVPGGAMIFKIMKKYRPKGVAGVACLKELVQAAEEVNIPAIGIELLRDGCVNTDISIREVFSFLEPDGKALDKENKSDKSKG